MADETRERDRVAAVSARATALRTIPAVAAGWVLVVVTVDGEFAVRVATLAALATSVGLGARAAVTARRFLQRWLDPEELRPPPNWVTLLTVAGAVATFVGGANIAADISADRPAVRAIVLTTVFLAGTLAAAYAHVAGGRGLSTALRPPAAVNTLGTSSTPDGPAPTEPLGPDADTAEGGSVRGLAQRGRVQAAPDAQMAELRLLLGAYLRARPETSTPDTAAAVADFCGNESVEVVAAARSQLIAVRARTLREHALAQVITLLGATYHPPDHGTTYADWVDEIGRTLDSSS